ncbi:peroxiredoxin-like family protein [Rhodoferax aquaticus]|uniref:thioredoxin-dependent peroxiredoxin n=1 Tax=Rhodoferax aquaticus TaxID=2527691 RepID=A0A515EJW3_9BURK|nr:peroxiredoxin-like family protein [Rhodoferax aquaticus]QDL52952.1 AhpC/TSA family protein [Rhodoferax aquaticus]
MTLLKTQLSDYQAGFKQRAAPERVAMMESATAQLQASGIEHTALGMAESLPSVELLSATGSPVQLKALHAGKRTVVVFYRGGWCPYCNLTLREWQRLLPELAAVHTQLIAISPQLPDASLSTKEKNALAYPVLSDSSLAAAHAFGIAFTLPPDLAQMYASVGNDLPSLNGNGQWVLPVPATFVFDTEGEVIYRHVEADYRQRAEPVDILQLLRSLA